MMGLSVEVQTAFSDDRRNVLALGSIPTLAVHVYAPHNSMCWRWLSGTETGWLSQ